MPAVHTSDDGCSEDLPLAVHWVQVLQRLRHLREWREPLLCYFQHVSSVFPQKITVKLNEGNTDSFFNMFIVETLPLIVTSTEHDVVFL